MNIGLMARTPLLVALFLGTTLGGLTQSYAGFQVTDQTAPQAPAPAIVSNVQMDGSPLPPATKTKALEIFNDRYVPDSVRKKYNLDDNWFGKNAPPEAAPTPLTPTLTPVLADPTTLSAQPVAAPEPKVTIVESWRGRKGENIRDVLQRWSVRGGANLMWASPDAPVLQKEFTFVGKFQDAVNALIKAEGGDKIHSQYRSEGLNPVMMAPASTVTTNTAPAVKDVPLPEPVAPTPVTNPLAKIFQPEEKKDVKPETRWFALSGAPLAEVMRVWADDAGVQLIWQSERNFAVKESISQVGHFEDAVYKALSQYDNEDVRPVGEMYADPTSGQQVLLVRTEVK
jgi:hypothetical protein